jgi:hypothetical protein
LEADPLFDSMKTYGPLAIRLHPLAKAIAEGCAQSRKDSATRYDPSLS